MLLKCEAKSGMYYFLIGGADKAALDSLKEMIPLQRLGSRTEIAEACLFLLSPLSSFTTGAVLVVDGGEWMARRGMSAAVSKL